MYDCWNKLIEVCYNKCIPIEIREQLALLKGQYHLGIEAKKEAYYILVELGYIENEDININ